MRRTNCLFGVALLAGLSAVATPFSVSRAEVPAQAAETVLVLPFTALSGAKDEWVGRAVQQDLLTDLTQGTNTRVLAPASAPAATDSQIALQSGHEQGASFVVFGQAQLNGREVRLTGQVLDVNTGKPLGGLKATGPSDELFHLEDALAGQVFLALPRTLLTAQTQQGIQQAGSNSAQQATMPAQVPAPNNVYTIPNDGSATDVYSPPAYYSYPNYTYNYYQSPDVSPYYPAYTYGYPDLGWWPYWDSGIIIGGFGFGGRFHDHDFHHHWDGRGRLDNGGRGFASAGRGFAGTGTRFGSTGANHFAPVRSGFGNTGFSRMGAAPRISSGGFHAGVSRGGSFGGFRGGSGGGFHGGGGGGGHR